MMGALKENKITKADAPASGIQNTDQNNQFDNFNTNKHATELWSCYGKVDRPQLPDHYQLHNAPNLRQTSHGDLAVAIYTVSRWNRGPDNLVIVKNDGRHRYLSTVLPGQYAVCNNCTIDPGTVIVAESYLSGLAIADRYLDDYIQVVACFAPDNILPVITMMCDLWPGGDYVAAPDSAVNLPDGICTITPPKNLTWLDLHSWEVTQCIAA